MYKNVRTKATESIIDNILGWHCHGSASIRQSVWSSSKLRLNFPSFLLRNVHSSSLFLHMASRKTDKQLLLSAMLGSKDEAWYDFLSVTDLYLDIEVEGVDEDAKPSYYSVKLYLADIKVAKSKKSKPQSSVVKLDWKENKPMSVLFWLYSL